MSAWISGLGLALWLGILTSISPCPLAANIAAISFISRGSEKPRYALLTAIIYTIGRTAVYVVLGALLSGAFLTAPRLSSWLQLYMIRLLGPLLIITGTIMLDLVPLSFSGHEVSAAFQKKMEKAGLLGALLLGGVFALTFCPVSAALFFGSLIPLSVKMHSSLAYPISFGVGSALPVVGTGIVLALGLNRLSSYYSNMKKFDRVARKVTGGICLLIGLYFTVKYTLQLV